MARRMTFDEGKQYKMELQRIMQTWSIVAFDYGKMDGRGYGSKMHEDYSSECGEGFIVIPGHYS